MHTGEGSDVGGYISMDACVDGPVAGSDGELVYFINFRNKTTRIVGSHTRSL